MMDPSPSLEYAAARQDQSLDELKELLRIHSISTLPEHKPDMRRAAEWLAARSQLPVGPVSAGARKAGSPKKQAAKKQGEKKQAE